MKTKLLCLVVLLCAGEALAQKSVTTKEFAIGARRRGFVGISGGPSYPIADFFEPAKGNAKTGWHLNALNASYLFGNNVGITGKLLGGMHDYKPTASPHEIRPWRYGAFMLGPVFSLPVHRNIELDFRATGGMLVATFPTAKGYPTHTSSPAFAFGLASTLQFNFSRRIGLHAGAEYLHSKVRFKELNQNRKNQNISTITPTLGVAYRFGNK